MIVVISPAKTLDYETPPTTSIYSQPAYLEDSRVLVEQLKTMAPGEISELMSISDALGVLNANRFQTWHTPFTPENAKQAVLAFKGDVYVGLEAESLNEADLAFAQKHLRILSGLYGLLKPLDLIQPYRLEMGTSLKNERGANLYSFWGERLTQALNQELVDDAEPVLVNLASNEYFKAIKPKALQARIITPQFLDRKGEQYKIVSFWAKKARGMMSAYIIRNRLTQPEQLKQFDVAGYAFNAERSTGDQWVFTRDEPPRD